MNPLELFKNFQNIQGRVKEIQEKLKDIKMTGSSGGDMVQVEVNGQLNVTNVTISKEAVDPDDIPMLEDLVLAAFTDAQTKIKDKIQAEMAELTGGMNIPPGLMGM